MNKTKHKCPYVPGRSKYNERVQFVRSLAQIWTHADQLIFCDAKKWKNESMFAHALGDAYCDINRRPSREQMRSFVHMGPILPKKCELFAGIGYLPSSQHTPLMSDPRRKGTVGAVAYRLVKGRNFNGQDLLDFVQYDLCPLLNPYPGPRSIVLLDNCPTYRKLQPQLLALINAKGAILIWNPPSSPDMNPIEHFWVVITDHCARLMNLLWTHPLRIPMQALCPG